MAVLAADGFSEIHFLHGITKSARTSSQKEPSVQKAISGCSKARRETSHAAEWRPIKGQLLEALTSTLGHPNIDASLPRTVVLVLTGRLRGTAQIDFADFCQYVRNTFPNRTLELWDRESLVELIEKHGPEQIYSAENIGATARSCGFTATFCRASWRSAISNSTRVPDSRQEERPKNASRSRRLKPQSLWTQQSDRASRTLRWTVFCASCGQCSMKCKRERHSARYLPKYDSPSARKHG